MCSHLVLESDCPGNSGTKQSSIHDHTTPKLCLVKYKCKTRGWKSCHHPFMGMSMVDHALIHPVPAPPSAIVVFTSLLQSGIILGLVSPSVPSLSQSLCVSLFLWWLERGEWEAQIWKEIHGRRSEREEGVGRWLCADKFHHRRESNFGNALRQIDPGGERERGRRRDFSCEMWIAAWSRLLSLFLGIMFCQHVFPSSSSGQWRPRRLLAFSLSLQGLAKRWAPGCVNAACKAWQKWLSKAAT